MATNDQFDSAALGTAPKPGYRTTEFGLTVVSGLSTFMAGATMSNRLRRQHRSPCPSRIPGGVLGRGLRLCRRFRPR
jgi:hypothetical protein